MISLKIKYKLQFEKIRKKKKIKNESGGIVRRGNCLQGESSAGAIVCRGNCPRGNCPTGKHC